MHTLLSATGQLVGPQHQLARMPQPVMLPWKLLGAINTVNIASRDVKRVQLSGMTRLMPIGATLTDYGSQLMFCLAVVVCQRTLLSTKSPLIDSSPRRLPRSTQTLPKHHHRYSVHHTQLCRSPLLHFWQSTMPWKPLHSCQRSSRLLTHCWHLLWNKLSTFLCRSSWKCSTTSWLEVTSPRVSIRNRGSGMDTTDVSSYRPISNLPALSKLMERLVVRQLPQIRVDLDQATPQNCRLAGAVRHSLGCHLWCGCPDPSGSFSCIRQGWLWDSVAASTDHLQHRWRHPQMVQVIPAWPVAICTNWDLALLRHRPHLQCPSKISPFYPVHHQPDFYDRKPWSDTALICRRHTGLWLMSPC